MTDTTVRERGIVMDAESVRALLDGRKTQHRVPIASDWWRCLDPDDEDDRAAAINVHCPYGRVGERLYVKEHIVKADAVARRSGYSEWAYAADGKPFRIVSKGLHMETAAVCTWYSPRNMPRWASRLLLEIIEIRVHRVKEVSEEEARAEGLEWSDGRPEYGTGAPTEAAFNALDHFPLRWNDRHARRGYPFESNPFVWALTFRRMDDD